QGAVQVLSPCDELLAKQFIRRDTRVRLAAPIHKHHYGTNMSRGFNGAASRTLHDRSAERNQ
ncbi:MAG: hypothetical protein ABW094_19395, partial [Candidatus Thiodiazotropha sp.]